MERIRGIEGWMGRTWTDMERPVGESGWRGWQMRGDERAGVWEGWERELGVITGGRSLPPL